MATLNGSMIQKTLRSMASRMESTMSARNGMAHRIMSRYGVDAITAGVVSVTSILSTNEAIRNVWSPAGSSCRMSTTKSPATVGVNR